MRPLRTLAWTLLLATTFLITPSAQVAGTAVVQDKNRVAKPSEIDGDWEGTIVSGSAKLPVVIHITTFVDGMTATMDSPTQKAFGRPVTSIARDGAKVRFEVKPILGSYAGTVDAGLATITGTWTQQGQSVPLAFKRVPKAVK